MRKITSLLLLIQSGLMMAQTETVVTPNGKRVTFNPNNWTLTGNAGTNITSNFLGTTDYNGLVFRTSNIKRVEIEAAGNVVVGSPLSTTANGFYMNVANGNFMGGARNTLGGNYAFAYGLLNKATADRAAVLGGTANGVSGISSAILGGENNTVSGVRCAVIGGDYHTLTGTNSVILGGTNNKATGTNSFAIGQNVTVDAPNAVGIGTYINLTSFYNGCLVLADNSSTQLVVSKPVKNSFTAAFTGGYDFFLDRTRGHGMTLGENGLIPQQPATGNIKLDLGTSTTSSRWGTIYLQTTPNISSDIRLKTNIKPLQYGLKEILAINPISYSLKSDAANKIQLGVSAQELQQILPETVTASTEPEKYLGVAYTEMIPVLINAVKEQQKEITEQTKEITEQQKQITELKTLVAKLIQSQSASKNE